MALIVGCILIYYVRLYYGHRNGILVVQATISAIIFLLIGTPLRIYLDHTWHVAPEHGSVAFLAADAIHHCFYTLPYWFVVLWTFMRLWLIHYDIQYLDCCSHIEWKQYLNDSDTLKKTEWFIEHRGDFGCLEYIQKRVAICSLSTVCIISIYGELVSFGVIQNGVWLGSMLAVLTEIAGNIMVIILWRNTPYISDRIYLYKEYKYITYLRIAAALALFLSIVLYFLLGNKWYSTALPFLAGDFIFFSMPFLSTYWVLKHTKSLKDAQYIYSDQLQREDDQTLTLRAILSADDTINLFMKQLIDDFSMECLLAFVEFHQFRQYAISTLNVVDEKDNAQFMDHWNFAENIPRSSIVYDDDEKNDDVMHEMKNKAYQLYTKYVKNGAELEINIRGLTRKRLNRLMADYDHWMFAETQRSEIEMVRLFDKCIYELFGSLTYAATNFRAEELALTQTTVSAESP